MPSKIICTIANVLWLGGASIALASPPKATPAPDLMRRPMETTVNGSNPLMEVQADGGFTYAVPRSTNSRVNMDSIYSHHDWQSDCILVDASPPEGPGAHARLVCPGPGEMSVMLSDDDGRVSLDYTVEARFGPWESFRRFNNVSRTIEWRRQYLDGGMVPFATVHRWHIGPKTQQRQILVISTVARHAGEESCMVGYVETADTREANQVARRVADYVAPGFDCGNDRPRGFGWIDPATPALHHVGGQR